MAEARKDERETISLSVRKKDLERLEFIAYVMDIPLDSVLHLALREFIDNHI